MIFGISLLEAFCVVPPKPVTLQNKSYSGTDAKDKPSIIKKINTNIIGVNLLLLKLIIFPYYKFRYCKKSLEIKKP